MARASQSALWWFYFCREHSDADGIAGPTQRSRGGGITGSQDLQHSILRVAAGDQASRGAVGQALAVWTIAASMASQSTQSLVNCML